LPRCGGMLGRANELVRCLETSTALGAHYPRLPAPAVFFQHPVQRHALAAAVVAGIARSVEDALCSAGCPCAFVDANHHCAKPPAPVLAGARQSGAAVAGAGERFASGGSLAGRVFGQHRRMARAKNAFAPRWNLD